MMNGRSLKRARANVYLASMRLSTWEGLMLVTYKILDSLRKRPERDAWHLASALQATINALFELEKPETDPETLRALAAASIEASKDLQAVLGIIASKIDVGAVARVQDRRRRGGARRRGG